LPHAERAQEIREAVGGAGQLCEAHVPGRALLPEPAKGGPARLAVAIDDRVTEVHLAVTAPSERPKARVPGERAESVRPALPHGFALAATWRRFTATLLAAGAAPRAHSSPPR